MPELPTQVPWRRFVCVLRKLGYTAEKTKHGSARSFVNPGRIPNVVSFREPHPGQNLRPPSCGAYAIGTLGLKSLEHELNRCLEHPDPLLRETARQAKVRLHSAIVQPEVGTSAITASHVSK